MIENYFKSFKSIILSVLVLLILSSCDPKCVEPYEYDSKTIYLSAYPQADVSGANYNNETGGQVVAPYSTGLRTNGQPLIVKITGSWSAWEELKGELNMAIAPVCDICFKKDSVNNCICKDNEQPQKKEFDMAGNKNTVSTIDCNRTADQNNPNLCTCTKQYGITSDLDNYVITTNHQTIDEIPLSPDDQKLCRYNAGLGAYIGLYGRDGVTMPKRLYHMYSTEKVCDIGETNGECIDKDTGMDVASYIYRSPNDKIFIKDDKAGNNGSDISLGDDEYHQAGEVIKLSIYDRYYADNYGGYSITFMGGIMKDQGKCTDGVVECIVGVIEDALLGEMTHNNSDGSYSAKPVRQGGILESMYNIIVQDSVFITIIQMSLILYITFFGMIILMGGVEISPKEISTRIMKIALVLFFTSSTSWYWYNQIIVGFFKYGMDDIIGLFSSIIESDLLSHETSLIKIAQGDRIADAASQASRFAYADTMILDFISKPVNERIWGLLFGIVPPFSILYIICIYILIGFLIYTILTAAIIYITALIRLVLVLALGPLFILASLFNKTESMFKGWIAFIAARSLEMIVLFLILYTFLILIDEKMRDLLYYKTCLKSFNIGFTNIDIQTIVYLGDERSHLDWVSKILTIAGIIFLLNMIIDKIPNLIQDLISISGKGANPVNAAAFANGIMRSFAGSAINAARKMSTSAYRTSGNIFTDAINRSTTLSNARIAIGRAMPIRGSEAREIDKVIEMSIKAAKADNVPSDNFNRSVRKAAISKLSDTAVKEGKSLNHALISDRLNKKLVEEPLRDFINQRSEVIKADSNNELYGKSLENQLRADARDWASKNFADPNSVDLVLNSLKTNKWYLPSAFQRKGSALRNASQLDRTKLKNYLASDNHYSIVGTMGMVKDAQEEYIRDLERYGYKAKGDGTTAPFQFGAPSRSQIRNNFNQELGRIGNGLASNNYFENERDKKYNDAVSKWRTKSDGLRQRRDAALQMIKLREEIKKNTEAALRAANNRDRFNQLGRYGDAEQQARLIDNYNRSIENQKAQFTRLNSEAKIEGNSLNIFVKEMNDQLAAEQSALDAAKQQISAEYDAQKAAEKAALDYIEKQKAEDSLGLFNSKDTQGINDFLNSNSGFDNIVAAASPDLIKSDGSTISNADLDKISAASDKIALAKMKLATAKANIIKLQLQKLNGEQIDEAELSKYEGEKTGAENDISKAELEKASVVQ